MDNVLLAEAKICLLTLHKYVCEGDEIYNFRLEEILSVTPQVEIEAMLFGWLASKGLWDNGIVASKLIELARKELL